MNNDELPPCRAQPTTPWMWPCVVNSCHGWGSDGSRAGGPSVQIYEAFEDWLDLGYTSSPNTLLGSSSIGRPVICIALDHRLHRLDQYTS